MKREKFQNVVQTEKVKKILTEPQLVVSQYKGDKMQRSRKGGLAEIEEIMTRSSHMQEAK